MALKKPSHKAARRRFIKAGTALGAAAAPGDRLFGGSLNARVEAARPGQVDEDVWLPTLCYVCNNGPHLIKVRRVNGVAIDLQGNDDFKEFGAEGATCARALGVLQKAVYPYRVKSPLRRTNPKKGQDVDPGWVELSWDEALDIVAEKLKAIRKKNTRELALSSPSGGMGGTMSGTWDDFWKAFGPTTTQRSGGGIKCYSEQHILGRFFHNSFVCCYPPDPNTRYILIFGRNPVVTQGVDGYRRLADLKASGAKIILLDPVLTATGKIADEWIPIKPKTDVAFVLAMLNVLLYEIGKYDIDFVKNRTNSPYLVGSDGLFVREPVSNKPLIWDTADGVAKTWDDPTLKCPALEGTFTVSGVTAKPSLQMLKEHVKGNTPEWASEICQVPAETIRRVSQEFIKHAQIGSTIQIEGATFPYRPVSICNGRGSNVGLMAYDMELATHILLSLMGAINVPGGDNPVGQWFYPVGKFTPDENGFREGLLEATFPWTWPPVSTSGVETLLPFGTYHTILHHMAWVNTVNPRPDFPVPQPLMLLKYRSNPMLGLGDPAIIEKALLKIPFIVSFSHVIDETAHFADIILPENTDLETSDIAKPVALHLRADSMKPEYEGWACRQRVHEPMFNTREMADILTDLADRMGILAAYNSTINKNLRPEDQLKTDKKYLWEDILDRKCKAVTDGKHDFEWFKTNGVFAKPAPKTRNYLQDTLMSKGGVRYELPYQERLHKLGQDLRKNLNTVGVTWWDRQAEEYHLLPEWTDDIHDIFRLDEEYNLHLIGGRAQPFAWANNAEIPWIIEVAGHIRGQKGVIVNAATAKAKDISNGDWVWVESPLARTKGKAFLFEGIRPDTVAILGQFGHWSTPMSKEEPWTNFNFVCPLNYEVTSGYGGGLTNMVKVKVYKA